jgi:hypothetical protein
MSVHCTYASCISLIAEFERIWGETEVECFPSQSFDYLFEWSGLDVAVCFFESIAGVSAFVGGRTTEEYILPLLSQAITGIW